MHCAVISAGVVVRPGNVERGHEGYAGRHCAVRRTRLALKDDSSNDIVSWVDGQVVSDWSAEIAKRERAIDGYLSDTDDVRAAKYGFRSGQNPQLGWSWFRDYPVGFNGVPFVLFKTILDLDPNDPDPTLRRIARIWKRESPIPLGTGRSATRWTFDHLGVGPTPFDYVDGIARPVGERTVTVAVRLRVREPAHVRAAL